MEVHIIPLAPRILRWLLDFRKICAPLFYTKYEMYIFTVDTYELMYKERTSLVLIGKLNLFTQKQTDWGVGNTVQYCNGTLSNSRG
jgi:hypothetical protein